MLEYMLSISLGIKDTAQEEIKLEQFMENLDKEISKLKSRINNTPIIFVTSGESEAEKAAGKVFKKHGYRVLKTSKSKNKYCQGFIIIDKGEKVKIDLIGVARKDIFGDLKWQEEKHRKHEKHDFAHGIEAFNKDVVKLLPRFKEDIEKSKEYVFNEKDRAKLPGFVQEMLNHYAAADVLSIYYQKWKMTTLKIIYALGFLSILLFLVYHLLESKIMLIFYIVCFISAYGVYYYAKKKEMEIKYLDYRALAEGLRVQMFWCLAGIDEDVTDYYLNEQHNELMWIENAIRVVNINNTKLRVNKENFQKVLKNWIEDQHKFYLSRVSKFEQKLKKNKLIIKILMLATFAIGLLLFVGEYFTEVCEERTTILEVFPEHIRKIVFPKFEEILVKNWILLGLEIIAASAAVIENFIETTALSEQIKRYSRMLGSFDKANSYVSGFVQSEEYEKAQKCIKVIGVETLVENGEWLMLYRERPIHVPKK